MYSVTPEQVTSAFFTLPDPNATMQHIFDALLTDGIPTSAVRCLQRLPNGKVDITFGTQEMRDQFLRKSAFIVNRRPYGRRHIRMDIHTDIPSFLRFGKFLLRVFYEGQPRTCRRCNSPDHLAKDCKNTFCFNCDSIGHVSKQCPSNVKCCICKEESHKAIDCQLSWS